MDAEPGSQSLHIIIDGRMILPQMSGVGRYLLNLSSALIELGTVDNIELWLQGGLSNEHPALALSWPNFRTRVVSAPHMSLRGQLTIPYELARARPDLFHYPHFDLPLATPGRIVATIHDLKYIARPDFFPQLGKTKRWLIRRMTEYTCRRAALVICDSHYTAKDLNRRLNVPFEKIVVIPLGVEARFFNPLPDSALHDLRSRFGLVQPYILCLGERRPHKNLLHLIEAFEKFSLTSREPYQLVIAGKPYHEYHEPENLSRKTSAKITFIDHIPDADLPALYQASEAFALVSYYEGFGLPILEAMASGVPVVVSDRTSLPEVVGEAGILVSPDNPELIAEALHKATCRGSERQRLIALGRAHASRFTWQRCAEETLAVYRKAVMK